MLVINYIKRYIYKVFFIEKKKKVYIWLVIKMGLIKGIKILSLG